MINVNLKNKKLLQLSCSLLLASATGVATAAMESESNNLFMDADFAEPGLNSGFIGDGSAASNDVDIWKFDLVDGGRFSASISNGPLADFGGPFAFDPIIVLFMENAGQYSPVAANDPFTFGTSFSFTPFASGTYFLTVSAFGNSPMDGFGNLQYDSQFHASAGQASTTFSAFEGSSFVSFDYELSLNGAVTQTAVPVPAAVWLFGSGLLGLAGLARRKS